MVIDLITALGSIILGLIALILRHREKMRKLENQRFEIEQRYRYKNRSLEKKKGE